MTSRISITSSDTCDIDLDRVLQRQFGWRQFLPMQRPVIESVLAGHSSVAVMPTGGGKSLCYQLPAIIFPGITVVVSPLISLMKDQVDALSRRKISAAAIHSGQSPYDIQRTLTDMIEGRVALVYVAPERLHHEDFLRACQHADVSLIAVDEAHCVSQWGHDFRPEYRFISDFQHHVGHPPILALTATATPRVQRDIALQLDIDDSQRFIAGVDRPNLWLGFERCRSVREKRKKIVSLVRRSPGSTIVYVTSRKDADELSVLLRSALNEPVDAYHAGLPPAQRTAVQNRFMNDIVRVVTATNAFGMGIDKPDIRSVIHGGIPDSIEGYYQEIGRAGRDGAPAECTMVTVPGMDVKTRQYLIGKDEPNRRQVGEIVRRLDGAVGKKDEIVVDDLGDPLTMTVLSHLRGLGLIEIVKRTRASIRLRLGGTWDDDVLERVWEHLEQHTHRKYEQFRDVRTFVYLDSSVCRRTFLTAYFGENTVPEPDDCCSACHPRPARVAMVRQQFQLAAQAGPLFEKGRDVDDVAIELRCSEEEAWELFLRWIIETTSDVWKDQVQKWISRHDYVVMRSTWRGRLQKSVEDIKAELNDTFDIRRLALTRAIMLRAEDGWSK